MKTIRLPFIDQLGEQLDGARIQVIMGPRQVGKTSTLLFYLESKFKPSQYHYESCDVVTDALSFFSEVWKFAEDGKILVLDEIQKIENWSEYLKKFWDQSKRQKKKIKCIVLGSSSLRLQAGLKESLTGRFDLIPVWQWTLPWSTKAYGISFDQFLKFGGYPGSYQNIENQARWRNFIADSIVETVIGKDILTQAKVKSPALFRQAFHILCSYPAQEISYSKLLGQVQDHGNIDLIKYYIELFEGAYLLKPIFKYAPKNTIKTKSSSPKIIPMAPALSTYHRLNNLDEEYLGRVFEGIVGADLIKAGIELFYWREGNFEVDYVFEVKGKLIALEIKSKRKRRPQGLQQFLKTYPKAKTCVLTFDSYIDFIKDPIGFFD